MSHTQLRRANIYRLVQLHTSISKARKLQLDDIQTRQSVSRYQCIYYCIRTRLENRVSHRGLCRVEVLRSLLAEKVGEVTHSQSPNAGILLRIPWSKKKNNMDLYWFIIHQYIPNNIPSPPTPPTCSLSFSISACTGTKWDGRMDGMRHILVRCTTVQVQPLIILVFYCFFLLSRHAPL